LVPNWTYDPIVHVTAPGHIAVRCAGKLIGAIERGLVVDATLDVFDSQWLKAMFEREREEARALHAASQVGAPSPTAAEHSLIGKVGQHMLRRAIQLVRGAHHGGLILVLDTEGPSACRASGLRLKYSLLQDEPSHRYRTLLLRILQAVAERTTKPSVGWADFAAGDDVRFAELEGEVFELSRVVANLTAIDGALVLDKRFGLLGFGAEVSAELPSPERVYRALDAEGVERQAEDIENVGTRHRAAYRFVNDHPNGLAVVVSQDGGVTFVANRDDKVVFWEQSVSP
jgi:DisA bacterial checkpoint controller nucleotide-binding